VTGRPSKLRLAVVALAMVAATSCRSSGRESGSAEPVTVFAAASLVDAFGELARGFRTTPGGVAVELNFGASSGLGEQILAGAPADVFASANASTMATLVRSGAAVDPVDFATNRLQVAVPPGNPAGVTGLRDFAAPEHLLGLCAEEVPCGQLARHALAGAGVNPSIDTNEANVRSLLTKIQEGELDAGIVYRSDVHAGGDRIEGVDIPPELNVTTAYPITVLAEAVNSDGGDAFLAYVLSDRGQAVLAAHGFDGP
jgi:molybdate transport system substrate-binding protein